MDNEEHYQIMDFIESSVALEEADKDNEDFINQDRNLTKGTNRRLGDFYDNKI
jgi:hypothetical protein